MADSELVDQSEILQEIRTLRRSVDQLKEQVEGANATPVGTRATKTFFKRPSVRACFVLLSLFAILAAWLGAELRVSRKEAKSGGELRQNHARIQWTPSDSLLVAAMPGRTDRPHASLIKMFGIEFFNDLTGISYQGRDPDEVEAILQKVDELPSLKELRIQNTKLALDDVTAILQRGNLVSLDLRLTGLEEGPLVGIEQPNLRWFDGSHTWLGDEAATDIANSPSIEYLDLSRTRLSDKGLQKLAKMPNLRWLVLRRALVTTKAITKFADANPQIYIQYEPLIINFRGVDRTTSRKMSKTFGIRPSYDNLPGTRPHAPLSGSGYSFPFW